MARVELWGVLQDVAGWRERRIDAPDLSALRAMLAREDAALGERLEGPGVMTVIGDTAVVGDAALTSDSEVSFMPPMSGG